jgi:hypothetical protein
MLRFASVRPDEAALPEKSSLMTCHLNSVQGLYFRPAMIDAPFATPRLGFAGRRAALNQRR